MRTLAATIVAGTLAAGGATAARAAERIQPGMLVRPAGSASWCTANFVFDGAGAIAGRTFIGLASHCVDDVTNPVMEDAAGVPFGSLAHKTWPLATIRDDWALIEILPERLGDVDPAQRGNPRFPSGVAGPHDVALGDEIRISGWGQFLDDEELQTQRSGYTTFWDGDYYELLGPVFDGDSGGALMHVPSGKALGVVSAYCVPFNNSPDHVHGACRVYGPTAAEMLRGMERAGFPARMRLAGEPPPPPPAPAPAPAPQASPEPQPSRTAARKKSTRRKSTRKKPRCKTRKQRRSKACRRKRTRRR